METKSNFLTLANSQSEPNLLATAASSGFPPGTTVDELWHYRRKKPLLSPIDNLTLLEGSFQLMKTEYTRRFKNYYRNEILDKLKLTRQDISPVRAEKPDDSWTVVEDGLLDQVQSESSEKFVEFPWEKPERRRPAGSSFEVVELAPENETERLTEFSARFQQHPVDPSSPHFHKFTKRPTQLHLEPEPFSSTTEQTDKYKEYELGAFQKAVRRPSTLKLTEQGALMESKTENRDKFVAFEPQPRPPLCKKSTNLHLEGLQQVHQTEKQRQFVQHELQPRPPLTKTHTNLHVEGELDFLPEYKKEFVEFKHTERRKLALPVNNLKPDGFYEEAPLDNHQFHPQIPFLRGGQEFNGRSSRRESFLRQPPMESENQSEFVQKSVPKTERHKASAGNLCLEGAIDMNCEYRNAYIDFNKEKGFSPTKIKSRRVSHQQQHNLKSEGKMEISPEYSSTYVNFPRERPHVRKPECSLSSEGELEHVTEQTEKFIAFPNASRSNSLKREPELKLSDNHFECQPEYRKAYIDYLIRERVDRRHHRPIDNLSNLQQKRAVETDPTEKTTLTVPPPSLPAKKPSAGKDGRNLSQIESSVFGPKVKLTAPSTSSRSSSPNSLQKTRKSKSLPRTRSPESAKRFNQAVRVENLACRQSAASPSRRENYLNVSAKNKWMRDSSIESNSAFVVLDKAEINNNTYGPLPHPPNRDTRWRPSWS